MSKVKSETEYNVKLGKVYNLMKKGEKNLSIKELSHLKNMANEIESYEKTHYPFPMPKTLNQMIELKMFERKLNKAKMAKLLGVSAPKLSEILNDKRKPDLKIVKAVYKKLEVDGNFILEVL